MNKLLQAYWPITLKWVNAFTLSAILVLPGLIWAALDKSLWWGDPCGYALHSVSVYYDLTTDLAKWKDSLFNFYKSPMIFWIGEFFVPLGKVLGSLNFALLLIPLIAAYIALVLLFRSFESLFKSKAIAICGSLMVAASPLFSGLSLGFWIEPMQVAIVSWFIYALTRVKTWTFYFSLSQFIIAISLAMLIKVSSPLYIIGPSVAFWAMVWRDKPSMHLGKREILYLVMSFWVFLPTVLFYFHNLHDILGFANYASTSPLFFGSDSSKISLWSNAMSNGIFRGGSYAIAIVLFMVAVLRMSIRRSYDSFGIAFIVSLFQVAIFFFVWLRSPNDDNRYFLPVLPYCAFLVCWSLANIGNRMVTAIAAILLLIQLGAVNGYAFGWVESNPPNGMIHALVKEAPRDLCIINDLIPLATRDSAIIFDLYPKFGPVEFSYEMAKRDLSGHWALCSHDLNQFFNIYRQELDTAKINIDTVWQQLLIYNPDFYITTRSRLSPDSATIEMKRMDKYTAVTIPARWAIAERMRKCPLYKLFSLQQSPELLVYKRANIPLGKFPRTPLVRITGFQTNFPGK